MCDSRAVAPVIGVLVLVATTVVASALVAVVALGPGGVTAGGDRSAASTSPSRFTVTAEGGSQHVTVRYLAGPPLAVSSLEVVVEADGRSGRLVDLPAGRGERCFGDPDDVLGRENVANETIFSRACGDASGAITAKESDGVWEPGETATVTVKVADSGGVTLDPGDTVRVAVVDASAVVGEATATVG